MPDMVKITGNKPLTARIMGDLLAYLKHTILNAAEYDKRHFSFHKEIHHVISDGSIHRKYRCINGI